MSLLLDEIRRATARLAEADVASPRAEAELLAAHVHGVRRGELHAVADADFDTRFWEAVDRRAAREPLQQITGVAYFRHLELSIGPGVFIPRPETEVMTGWAIGALRGMGAPVVADLGTGSAAIALSIALEVPAARVYAVEADPLAAAHAARNIAAYAARPPRHGRRVSLVKSDFVMSLRELDGSVDLVISNPPYIPLGASVPPEVGEYDPPSALWSGPDGLNAIRSVARVAGRLLRPGGLAAVEHGAPQGAAVREVFRAAGGWRDIAQHADLAGRDRFVTVVRQWQDGQRALSGSRVSHNVLAGGRGLDVDDRSREPSGPALAARFWTTLVMSDRYDCSDPGQRAAGLAAAAAAVRRGELVVLPTDTVYGVGADAFSPAAVARLLAAKGRGRDMPPPVLVGTVSAATALIEDMDAIAQRMIEEFWPGALTLVCRAARSLSWDLGDTRGTVAVRMPMHPLALDLLRETGPLAVSSANLSGAPAALTAAEAEEQIGRSVAVILDGGPATGGVASTMVDLTTAVPRLLRAGAISVEKLAAVALVASESPRPASPDSALPPADPGLADPEPDPDPADPASSPPDPADSELADPQLADPELADPQLADPELAGERERPPGVSVTSDPAADG